MIIAYHHCQENQQKCITISINLLNIHLPPEVIPHTALCYDVFWIA